MATKEELLWEAASFGQNTVVNELLLDPLVNVNWTDPAHGRSIFYRACFHGHVEIVQLLMGDPRVCVEQPQSEKGSPLFVACQNGHLPVVRLLLRDGRIDPNFTLEDGTTPLYIACQEGHRHVVEELLRDPRVSVTQPREDGASPMFIASELGHHDVVRELVSDERISSNVARRDGASPLFMAAQNGHVETVKCLLSGYCLGGTKKALDLEARWQNLTSAEQAKRNGHEEVVKVIETFQANPVGVAWRFARETGVAARMASDAFALAVLISDSYLHAGSQAPSSPSSPSSQSRQLLPADGASSDADACRFFHIVSRLPMDLQMVMSNRLFGLKRDVITPSSAEASIRRVLWFYYYDRLIQAATRQLTAC